MIVGVDGIQRVVKGLPEVVNLGGEENLLNYK